jgi:protein SCO1
MKCVFTAESFTKLRIARHLTVLLFLRFGVIAALPFSAFSGIALSQSQLPEPVRNVGIDQRLNEQLPLDIELRDESGRVVKLEEYFGSRPVILSLVYHECPMLCSEVLSGLLSSLRVLRFDLGREFDVLTVSFNPREDSALAKSVKESYLKRYKRPGADGGWHFLTGDQASIDRLTRAVGFRYTYDSQKNQYAHASGILVLTPQGRVSRYFYGIEFAPKDLRLALVEASQNRIGSVVDQVLLFCYHYDPITGKYGFVIMTAARVLGMAFVIGFGTFIAMMLRRERIQKDRG